MDDMADFNRQVIEEFRANEGRVGGMFEGAPMILITTTGARSGEPRTQPLVYRQGEGDTVYIFASKAGADTHPAWYHNLVANPDVVVEIGTDRYDATAEVLEGEERDRVFDAHKAQMPNFAEYEQKTSRVIPVVALHRA